MLTLRLFLKVYKNFEFIDKHYYSIVGVTLALFMVYYQILFPSLQSVENTWKF